MLTVFIKTSYSGCASAFRKRFSLGAEGSCGWPLPGIGGRSAMVPNLDWRLARLEHAGGSQRPVRGTAWHDPGHQADCKLMLFGVYLDRSGRGCSRECFVVVAPNFSSFRPEGSVCL